MYLLSLIIMILTNIMNLNLLEDWARLWKMSFNTSKCSIATFGNSGENGAASENFVLEETVLREVCLERTYKQK